MTWGGGREGAMACLSWQEPPVNYGLPFFTAGLLVGQIWELPPRSMKGGGMGVVLEELNYCFPTFYNCSASLIPGSCKHARVSEKQRERKKNNHKLWVNVTFSLKKLWRTRTPALSRRNCCCCQMCWQQPPPRWDIYQHICCICVIIIFLFQPEDTCACFPPAVSR